MRTHTRYSCSICHKNFMQDKKACVAHEAEHAEQEAATQPLEIGQQLEVCEGLGSDRDGSYTRLNSGTVIEQRGVVGRLRSWEALIEFDSGSRKWARFVGWPERWSKKEIAESIENGWSTRDWSA